MTGLDEHGTNNHPRNKTSIYCLKLSCNFFRKEMRLKEELCLLRSRQRARGRELASFGVFQQYCEIPR